VRQAADAWEGILCFLQGRGYVFKRFEANNGMMKHVLDKVDIGGAYSTDNDEFLATARARKTWSVGKGNRTASLKVGGEAEINTNQKVEARGRVELSTKLMNFTDEQDLKLKLGYGHKRIGVSNQFLKVSRHLVPFHLILSECAAAACHAKTVSFAAVLLPGTLRVHSRKQLVPDDRLQRLCRGEV
jgi:hypothetical protein